MKRSATLTSALALTLASGLCFADGPKDNVATNVRPIPPLGVEIPPADKENLLKGLKELQQAIEDAKKAQAKNPQLADLLPDVEIFAKSVDWAIRYNLFNKPTESKMAFEQLTEGKARAEALKKGETPWTRQKGLVVRAYRSKIDGSVQPYGLVIPDSYDVNGGAPVRLDFWIHGRGETLSELSFVDQRMKQKGQVLPKDAIVLHPYGRYCCANKFAGEVDLFEALAHAKKFYRIDDDRIVMRGFSMGGAAAWQFATHFADQWCAANPGAGFAETAEFLKVFQTEDVNTVPWWHKKLWGWYDSTDYAVNLMQCPTVAYSGEIDKQKQAADIMERFLKAEGLDLTHIIGPQTAHKIHPDSLIEIERRLSDITAVGRERTPKEVHFATKTLRYNQMNWVTLDGLAEHWEKSRVDAVVTSDTAVQVKTDKVTALTLDFPAGQSPFHLQKVVTVNLDGTAIPTSTPKLDRSFRASFQKKDGKWQLAQSAAPSTLAKRHGLSGPI
ncbi:MAG: prolyl oligopeptidase family serine peptidase, partial [Verrucomicrobium sp.]